MVIRINPLLTFDFNARVLKARFDGLEFLDTLNLSKHEIDQIIKVFDDGKVGELSGEAYFGTSYVFPSGSLNIKLYNKRKLQANIEISPMREINGPNPKVNDLMLHFSAVIKEVLNHHERYRKMRAETYKRNIGM